MGVQLIHVWSNFIVFLLPFIKRLMMIATITPYDATPIDFIWNPTSVTPLTQKRLAANSGVWGCLYPWRWGSKNWEPIVLFGEKVSPNDIQFSKHTSQKYNISNVGNLSTFIYIFYSYHQIFVKLCKYHILIPWPQNWCFFLGPIGLPPHRPEWSSQLSRSHGELHGVSWDYKSSNFHNGKHIEKHHSWSQHVMIRELNQSLTLWLRLPYFYHVFSLCVVIFWDVRTTLRLLKWPWPLFETVDWLQTPAEVPWSVIYSMNFETLDFFSRFTRILDKFHPPGTLVPFSVLCVFLWLRYLLLRKKNPRCGCRFHPHGFSKVCGGSNNNGGGFKICLKAQAGNLPKKTTLEVNTNSLVVVKERSGGKPKLHSWMALGSCGDLYMFSTLHIC